MRHTFKRENRRSLENPFLLRKPNSNGPLRCGGVVSPPKPFNDKQVGDVIKHLGWSNKHKKALINIKHKIFDEGGSVTPSVNGQLDGLNFTKKTEDMDISIFVGQWYMTVHIASNSDKKRDKKLDDVKQIIQKHMPGTAFAVNRSKELGIYKIIMAGSLNKPDSLCEGGENICKTASPPIMPKFHSPSEVPRDSIRGC